MSFVSVGAKALVVKNVGIIEANGSIVVHPGHGAESGEADSGFNSEVCLVREGAGAVIGGQLRGDVEAVGDEIVGVALKQGGVVVCEGGITGSESVGVG